MKWVTYSTRSNSRPRAAILVNDMVHGAGDVTLISPLADGTRRLNETADHLIAKPVERHRLEDVDLAAPIPCPPSIRDFMAFEEHTKTAMDTATTLGPWLITPDQIAAHSVGNRFDLAMSASVNGTRYSDGNLSDLHWSFGQMSSYASRGTCLVRGDIIGSGTVGTGCIAELTRVRGSDHYPWLKPGDTVTLSVEQLGSIETSIGPSRPVQPLTSIRQERGTR